MKNKMKKVIFVTVAISIIMMLLASNIAYASFAEFDDETADKQANEDLKEQEAINKENAGKSSNNYLEQLSVSGYELIPKFDKQTINYSIENEITDSEVEINAKAADERATIKGMGKVKLQSGENNLRVDVVAENGMTRTYFIKVTKKVENEKLKLSNLKLFAIDTEGNRETINLNENFNSDVYLYNCYVYSNIEKIELEATTENDDDSITIEGNDHLEEGKNTITVSIKNDDEDEVIYKIEVNKEVAKENNASKEIKKSNNKLYIVFLIIVILIIFIIKSIIKKNKRKH